MHPATRIEIIVSTQEVTNIIDILEIANAPGYTLIRNVIGKGNTGEVSNDLSSELSNVFIICYCP